MTHWLISLEGTVQGHQLAVLLALMSAFLHALFGALQKGRHDPWLSRGAIDFSYGMIAAPVALFLVPWPEPYMWPIFALTFVIHSGYKILQAMCYTRGAFTVVYPVVRGTAPLFAVLAAGVLFGEHFSAVQWLGVLTLLSGIFGLAAYNLHHQQVDKTRLKAALALAVLAGGFVAAYTTFDAYGVRATADPFTFLAWLFMFDGLFFMPPIAYLRWRSMGVRPPAGPLMLRGVAGAIVALAGFSGIILATRLDRVGEAAVLRETSAVFAALIGWILLKESTGLVRFILMALIAAGAVIVETGG